MKIAFAITLAVVAVAVGAYVWWSRRNAIRAARIERDLAAAVAAEARESAKRNAIERVTENEREMLDRVNGADGDLGDAIDGLRGIAAEAEVD